MVFKRLRQADLKSKKAKCNFLKANIQYLGHIISGEGITPVPEKLESLEQMSPPHKAKEVNQFLGLAGHYHKFVPRFTDIVCPLNALTRKGVEFLWTEVCQKSFELLKQKLLEKPILVYPDPKKLYILLTDANKYAWSCVLTQEHIHIIDSKEV